MAAAETPTLDRRSLLIGTAAAIGGLLTAGAVRTWLRGKSPVFIAAGQRYDGPLEQTIRDGLVACGIEPESVRGKRVLLKPNLVEPTAHART